MNSVGTEILRVTSSEEGVLDVGEGIGEGNEHHGGELPVGDSMFVEGAVGGAEFGEGAELELHVVIVDEVNTLKLLHV